jgi:probable F420-dependent oxidoreductase
MSESRELPANNLGDLNSITTLKDFDVSVNDQLRFIAPSPRLRGDGDAWVSDVRRLESLGFDTVAVSYHVTNGWQLGLVAAMAFAAASTSRLRVLSLVAQNDLQHPALLAKDIATIDLLSGGRVELGIGAGWLADDYVALGLTMEAGRTRVARLEEALEIISRYFRTDSVDFSGRHYQVSHMEALPETVQRPNPPILVAAARPRMLEVAGRSADIAGIHPRLGSRGIDGGAVADLTAGAIEAKIDCVQRAAEAAGRPTPRIQMMCYYVHVTDAAEPSTLRSSWADPIEAQMNSLRDSPSVLVGTAAECAKKILEWQERRGITHWHLGQDAEAASRIIEQLR